MPFPSRLPSLPHGGCPTIKTILAGLLFFVAAIASALDITDADGNIFRNCTALTVTGDELAFAHATGTARVRLDKLPAKLRGQYFTAETVASFPARQKAREAAADALARAKKAAELTAVAREEAIRAEKSAALARAKEAESKLNAAAAEARREREAMDFKAAQETRGRLENYRSGKWRRGVAVMASPTKDGQIMKAPWGAVIHVPGDRGLAQGEGLEAYFERDGNYDYITAGGGMARIQNYRVVAKAEGDISADLARCTKLIQLITESIRSGAYYRNLAEELTELEVRLKAEGLPVSITKLP